MGLPFWITGMKMRDLFEKPTGLENGDVTGMEKVTIP